MPQDANEKTAAPPAAQGTGAGISTAGKQPGQAAAAGAGSATGQPAQAAGAPSEDLVRKVADRVYALLMAEVRLDLERQRAAGLETRRRGGW